MFLLQLKSLKTRKWRLSYGGLSLLSLFETLHFIPERAVLWLMKIIRVMLKYCGQFSPHIAKVAEKLP